MRELISTETEWGGDHALPSRFHRITPQEFEPTGCALETAAKEVITLVVIVIPLMMLIQILKDLRFLDWLSRGLAPLLRPFGIAPRRAITLASGK